MAKIWDYQLNMQVIQVGHEKFMFSSAPEPGSLCDIYEGEQIIGSSRQVLTEAGSVWRKLSVLGTLNATEKKLYPGCERSLLQKGWRLQAIQVGLSNVRWWQMSTFTYVKEKPKSWQCEVQKFIFNPIYYIHFDQHIGTSYVLCWCPSISIYALV